MKAFHYTELHPPWRLLKFSIVNSEGKLVKYRDLETYNNQNLTCLMLRVGYTGYVAHNMV